MGKGKHGYKIILRKQPLALLPTSWGRKELNMEGEKQ